MTIPEYRADGASRIYPMPEPHKAGKDMSECRQTILAAALEMCEAEREKADIYCEALTEAWVLIGELRKQVEDQSEQIQALREYADGLVERQTREYELASACAERRAS